MIENTSTAPTSTTDIYDEDISKVDTSFSVLSANVYDLEIVAATKARNNAGTGDNLKIQFKTLSNGISTQGETMAAGATIHHNISLAVTEKYSATSIKKAVAQLGQAAKVTGTVRELMDNPERFVGQTVTAKVGVKPATDQYAEGNKIVSFINKV